jgi:DNA replicative helicase MCM subunit Mcm2 (Cdc46/Mcm family)
VSAAVIELDDHRPVWRVVQATCRSCGHECIATQHMGCPLDASECPECGEMKCSVTHYLRRHTCEVEGCVGEWEPRLEVVE